MQPDDSGQNMTKEEWEELHERERQLKLAEAKKNGESFSEVLKIAID